MNFFSEKYVCKVQIVIQIIAPECWQGKFQDLDSFCVSVFKFEQPIYLILNVEQPINNQNDVFVYRLRFRY